MGFEKIQIIIDINLTFYVRNFQMNRIFTANSKLETVGKIAENPLCHQTLRTPRDTGRRRQHLLDCVGRWPQDAPPFTGKLTFRLATNLGKRSTQSSGTSKKVRSQGAHSAMGGGGGLVREVEGEIAVGGGPG